MRRIGTLIAASALLAGSLAALAGAGARAAVSGGSRTATTTTKPAKLKRPKPTIRLGTYVGETGQGDPVTFTVSRAGTDGIPCSTLCLATPGATVVASSVSCGAATHAMTENIRVLATRIPQDGRVLYVFGDRDQPSTIALDTVTLTVDTRGEISGTLSSRVAAGDGTECDSGPVRVTASLRDA